jgi:hypothetical protein
MLNYGVMSIALADLIDYEQSRDNPNSDAR